MPRALRLFALLCLVATPVAAGDLAFVTCQNGDAVDVIDIAAGQSLGGWSVPGKPAGVAAGAEAVFTVAPEAKTLRRHDPKSGAILAETRLEGGPIGIARDGPRGRVFVSDWYNARIWVRDAATLAPQAELPAGAAPAGLALSPDGRFLASADRDADAVSIFDADTLAPLHQVTVGTRPFGLRFGPEGRLFVANVGSDDVTVLEPETGAVTATLPVGARPYGIAFAAGRGFVTNQYADSLSVFDLGTLAPIATLETGEYPEGIDATPDGRRILVANWFDNTVSIIDAETLAVLVSVETCDGPRAFGAFVLGGTK